MTPAGASAPRASEGRAQGSGPARSRVERRADERVRRVVARYGGCLAQLSHRQRRVLSMRAGIGPREPVSRAVVARRLDITVTRVRRVEHRAVRALRRAGHDGCAATLDTGTAAPLEGDGAASVLASEGGSGGADVAGGAGADGGSGSGANGGSGGGNGSGGSDGSGGASGGVKGIAATGTPPDPGDTGIAMPLLGALLLLVCVFGFGVETRRVWRSGMDPEA